MIITAHQPNYLPWLGFFHRMDIVDKFIILDNVQFTKDVFIQRNRIKTATGDLMITVPVQVKMNTIIRDVLIDNSQKWQKRHWLSIKYNYNRTQYWHYLSKELEEIYSRKWSKLFDLNIELIKLIKNKLRIDTELIVASKLNQPLGKKTNLLIDLCKYLNAHTFITGDGSKAYIDKEEFNRNKIKLIFHNFNHPIYPQRFGTFLSHLSILDLLFNCGPYSMEVLRQGGPSYENFI